MLNYISILRQKWIIVIKNFCKIMQCTIECCIATFWGATYCFLAPPLSYNISLLKPKEKAQIIFKELKLSTCLDNAWVKMIKNCIVMPDGFNMRHYDFPWPIADLCKKSIFEPQRILSKEKFTLVTKTLHFRLNEHLINLKQSQISLKITHEAILADYAKRNKKYKGSID